jgi:hypothetical protein
MAKSTEKPDIKKPYVLALNHELIYADKVLKFGMGPSVCKLEIGNESSNEHIISHTIAFSTFHFIEAIEHIHETINSKEAKLKLKKNLQDLLSKLENE